MATQPIRTVMVSRVSWKRITEHLAAFNSMVQPILHLLSITLPGEFYSWLLCEFHLSFTGVLQVVARWVFSEFARSVIPVVHRWVPALLQLPCAILCQYIKASVHQQLGMGQIYYYLFIIIIYIILFYYLSTINC